MTAPRNSPKWTPGPWQAPETGAGCIPFVANQQRMIICDIVAVGDTATGRTDLPQSDANAHLIAAAPELYSALRVMVQEWIEVMGDEHENSTPGDVLEKAKAALAKARGEAK